MRATIKQIAEVTGVSQSTISRALKNRGYVSKEKREKVLAAAEKLGYQPDAAAKALRMRNNPFRIVAMAHWDEFGKQIQEGMRSAAVELKDFSIQIQFVENSDMSYEEQYQHLQKLDPSGVDGLIIKPLSHPRIVDAITSLRRKDVPTITVNGDAEGSGRLCHLGQDYFRAGRVAGNLMSIALGGKGSVIAFLEVNPYSAYTNRYKGFESAIKEYGRKIRLLDCCYITENSESNFEEAKKVLLKYPEVNGVFCTGASYPRIVSAIRSLGRSDIRVVGYDIFEQTREMMEQGYLDFVITQDPFHQGYESVKRMQQFLLLHAIPEQEIYYSPIGIVERESIQQETAEGKPSLKAV